MAGTKNSHLPQRPPSVGIYHAPPVVSMRLKDVLTRAGYEVKCEVPCDTPLSPTNAALDADAWLTKWTFGLREETLRELHPRSALITMSVGTDHIDVAAANRFGVNVANCPSYCSISVAEHALALGFRALYGRTILPLLTPGTVVFDHFSDEFSESAVAQILMRSRQMEEAFERAKKFDYTRGDAPWKNQQLTGNSIGIVGKERDASTLAKILKLGFQCNLVGFDFDSNLEAFGVHQRPLDVVNSCDYVFNCSNFDLTGTRVDSRELPTVKKPFTGSNVLVLGAGGIGSIIARISKLGFDCTTASFSRSEKPPLKVIGINHIYGVDSVLSDSDFVFICLPLNQETVNIINAERLRMLGNHPVVVNVTRDEIIDSQSLYLALADGKVSAYGTDVLPDDKSLWAHGDPKEITRNFLGLGNVVATPHEADCSRWSLTKLVSEVGARLEEIER